MVSYADVEDVRGRFRSEPKSLQDTIRDRIGGTALSFITLSDRERAAQRMSLNRIIQTAEMLFGEEQARAIRYSHDIAAKLHDMGRFTIKNAPATPAVLTRGIMQTLGERMLPILEKSVRAHFKGSESDLTPEETGILSSEARSLLSYVLKTESWENAEMKAYLKRLIQEQEQLEKTLALANEGLLEEPSEKKHSLQASLPNIILSNI